MKAICTSETLSIFYQTTIHTATSQKTVFFEAVGWLVVAAPSKDTYANSNGYSSCENGHDYE
jgi:hypothetical protein